MAKLLDSASDFYANRAVINDVCDTNKRLPAQIFRPARGGFLFLLFDEIFLPTFFEDTKDFLDKIGETEFRLAVLDPDPEGYFYRHFGTYHLVSFSNTDPVDDYISILNQPPGDSHADAIIHNSNIVLFYSETKRWAIYADRDWEIAVCWFANQDVRETFHETYSGVTLYTADEAIKCVMNAFGDDGATTERQEIFRKNFSSDS